LLFIGKVAAVHSRQSSTGGKGGGESAAELLSLTYILSSLVFIDTTEQAWLKRRFGSMRDILRDTWAYKEIKKEGLEEGRQEGRQEGQREALRETLAEIVQDRFPNLEALAKSTADSIESVTLLRHIIVKMGSVQTEEAAKQMLLTKGHTVN
jgi:predicted transposase YdaD